MPSEEIYVVCRSETNDAGEVLRAFRSRAAAQAWVEQQPKTWRLAAVHIKDENGVPFTFPAEDRRYDYWIEAMELE